MRSVECMESLVQTEEQAVVERLSAELAKTRPTRKRRIIEKFCLAVRGQGCRSP